MMKRSFLSFLLIFVSLATFLLTLDLTRKKIGEPFSGYLTFKNGVVGAFYLPDWSGPKGGMTYHKRAPSPLAKEIFSKRDFFLIVILPAVSGLLFILLGTGLCLYLPEASARTPLLFFHFLVGNYLILSPEFHLTYRLSYLYLTLFSFVPATMIHFALHFPEGRSERGRDLFWISYLVSASLLVPYLYFFLRDPPTWMIVEYAIVFYVIGAYLFWLIRLVLVLRRPHLEFNRIIARYLLLGQVTAFVVPLAATIAIFVGGLSFPLNLASPLTILFPISLFVGVILGRLRQSQMQLVQTEKRAALGNLLAGLAHEINNPMTFVYSNLEPLREVIGRLPSGMSDVAELGKIADNIEEGATRTKAIIDHFRLFSYPGRGQDEEINVRDLLEHGISLLTPKWKGRVSIEQRFGDLPRLRGSPGELGQVFVSLLANAFEAIPGEGNVTLTTETDGCTVRIGIRDTGEGIPRDRLPRIFDPFFTTKAQGEGTGLGLTIASQIVRNHRGTIEVKSEVGKGTEFMVTLPLRP